MVDLVLLVMLAEYGVLGLAGRGWAAALAALLPGALLVLALRAAVEATPPPLALLMLALAFPAHLLDLHRRGWLGVPRFRPLPSVRPS